MLTSAQFPSHVGRPQTWQNGWPHFNWNLYSSNVATQALPAQISIGHPMHQGSNQISPIHQTPPNGIASGTPTLQGEFSRYPQTQPNVMASPPQGDFSRYPQTQPHIIYNNNNHIMASPTQQDLTRYPPRVNQPSVVTTAAPPTVTLYTRPIASNGKQKTEDTDDDYDIDIRNEEN
ncbi:hypothetical protein O0L34_g8623 [Tuta absoluta]|nr:hypothetical protein O0L34_g8623 [Tuta absoluta]